MINWFSRGGLLYSGKLTGDASAVIIVSHSDKAAAR